MNVDVILRGAIEPGTVEFDTHRDALRVERFRSGIPDSDLAALELALRLVENGGGAVRVIAWGPPAIDPALGEAAALSGGRIQRVWEPDGEGDPLATAELVSAAIRQGPEPVDLVLMGADADGPMEKAVPSMLAAALNWPIVSGVLSLTTTGASRTLLATRRMGRGVQEELEVELPAVLAIDARAGTLRSATWPQYLQAFDSEIPAQGAQELGCALGPTPSQLVRLVPPRPSPQWIHVPDQSLPPDDRLGQVLDAGARGRGGKVVEGEPAELVTELVVFLKEQKLI